MKAILLIPSLVFAALPFLSADEKDAGYHGVAGPTGGRLLVETEPHVEFFVNKAKKVEIRFVGDGNTVVAPGAQEVSVTIGEGAKAITLTFARDGDKLVSDKPVPAGKGIPTVVQIRTKAGATPVTERFNLSLNPCPTCKQKEYACICEHADQPKHKEKK